MAGQDPWREWSPPESNRSGPGRTPVLADVEASSGNVFADLALPDPELLVIKAQCASALRRVLAAHLRRMHESHARTARRLGLTPAAYDRLRTAVGSRGAQRSGASRRPCLVGVDFAAVPLDTYVRALAALGQAVTADVHLTSAAGS